MSASPFSSGVALNSPACLSYEVMTPKLQSRFNASDIMVDIANRIITLEDHKGHTIRHRSCTILYVLLPFLYLLFTPEILKYPAVLEIGCRLILAKINRTTVIITVWVLLSVDDAVQVLMVLHVIWLLKDLSRHLPVGNGSTKQSSRRRSCSLVTGAIRHRADDEWKVVRKTKKSVVKDTRLKDTHLKDTERNLQKLCNACSRGDLATVRDLLTLYSGNPMYSGFRSVPYDPLRKAVEGGSFKIFQLILQHVDVSANLPHCSDLLYIAVRGRHHRILALLLDFVPGLLDYINVAIRDTFLVVLAVEVRSIPCLRVLRLRGVRMTQIGSGGFCALDYAAECDYCDVVRYILNTSSMNDLDYYRTMIHDVFDNELENFRWDTVKTILLHARGILNHSELLHMVYTHDNLAYLDELVIGQGGSVSSLNEFGEVPFSVYLFERIFSLKDTTPLCGITDKLALHIKAGLDCNQFLPDENIGLTCIGSLLNCYIDRLLGCCCIDQCYLGHLKRLLQLLYESGYKFKHDSRQIAAMPEILRMHRDLTSNPWSLQRMCGNVVRCNLQPNAILGIQQLKLPEKLQKIVMLGDILLYH